MWSARTRTKDEAVGRWPGILQALGVDPKYLTRKHGACPMCQGKDRYRFDDKEGRGTWFCSRCGSGDGFELLRQLFGWGFGDAAKEVDRVMGNVQAGAVTQTQTEESKVMALRAAWREGLDVTMHDPVGLYLSRRLGLEVPPRDLRYHPGMRHSSGGVYPVMLALMRYADGSGASIHRTYLTEEGEKAPVENAKMFMPGKSLKTAAVRLFECDSYLGIAEGIETALAASRRFQMPVWAATNANLLECWTPPAGVRRILIAGDNDSSYTGQSAAFSLAKRLVRDGYAVEVQIPSATGKDWADGDV